MAMNLTMDNFEQEVLNAQVLGAQVGDHRVGDDRLGAARSERGVLQRLAPQLARRRQRATGRLDGLAFACERLGKALQDRKSTRLNSSHRSLSRMPSSA